MFVNADPEFIKYLIHRAKHEVILPKTMLLVEGRACNRLFILINGVLQASCSKQGTASEYRQSPLRLLPSAANADGLRLFER